MINLLLKLMVLISPVILSSSEDKESKQKEMIDYKKMKEIGHRRSSFVLCGSKKDFDNTNEQPKKAVVEDYCSHTSKVKFNKQTLSTINE